MSFSCTISWLKITQKSLSLCTCIRIDHTQYCRPVMRGIVLDVLACLSTGTIEMMMATITLCDFECIHSWLRCIVIVNALNQLLSYQELHMDILSTVTCTIPAAVNSLLLPPNHTLPWFSSCLLGVSPTAAPSSGRNECLVEPLVLPSSSESDREPVTIIAHTLSGKQLSVVMLHCRPVCFPYL